MKYRVLFLGTNAWACPILRHLQQTQQVVGVVTQPDKPAGRKREVVSSPVKVVAEELELVVHQPESAGEIVSLVRDPFDFLITVSYGQYLPQKVLEMPTKDALNVHPSPLPRYRGATPMQSALLNGDKETGVSIIRMVKEMDAGPVFAQERFALPPGTNYPALQEVCSLVGTTLLSSVLKTHDSITPKKQNEALATHCGKIRKEDGELRFDQDGAEQIYRKWLAYNPWPGIFFSFKDQKLSLTKIIPHPTRQELLPPGTIFQDGERVFVQTIRGCLEIQEVHLAGKTPMVIRDFLHGHPTLIQARLKTSV
ncbi:MAG: methionyl-tRNA formyltransferase [bacterium]|nr:methionyl-tRNA formyltransferase [bacterium]